jgi:hypothetical protein
MPKHSNLLKKINVHGAYARVFNSPDGEIVLEHICKVGFVGRPTRVKGDQEQSQENEGMRRLALSILRYAKKDHSEIVGMVEQEYMNE